MKTLIKGIIDILVSPYIVLGSYSCIIIMYYCGALYRDLLSVTHLFSLMVFAFIVVFAVLHGIFFYNLIKTHGALCSGVCDYCMQFLLCLDTAAVFLDGDISRLCAGCVDSISDCRLFGDPLRGQATVGKDEHCLR